MFGHVRARAQAEFRALLARAGFKLRTDTPTTSPASVIEATPMRA